MTDTCFVIDVNVLVSAFLFAKNKPRQALDKAQDIGFVLLSNAVLSKEQRLRLAKLLTENPSLKSSLDDCKEKIYPLAVISAEKETGLSSFPVTCPYEIIDILSAKFLPE